MSSDSLRGRPAGAYARPVRSALLLSLVAACGAIDPVADSSCPPSDWVLARAVEQCGDLRGGWSGFWVLEIVDGSPRGSTVIAYYGDAGASGWAVRDWNLARVDLGPTTPSTGWGNACAQFGPPPTHAGLVGELAGFDREADARRAFEPKRCAK